MPRHSRSKQKRPVHIHPPQLPHPVDAVVDRLEVLGEAGRGDEVVDPAAVGGEDLGYAAVDRGLGRDVCVVGCDFWDSFQGGLRLD